MAVTVNPTAVINSAATATRCNNVETTYTATTSTVATTTYVWTRATVTGISNPAVTNGTGAAITETLVNTSTEPVVVHYLITPSVNGCAGTTKDVAVTVNPTAVINSAATATRCNNVETTLTATTSTVATTTYVWTRAAVTGISNPAVTNGTGAAITETLVNTSTEPVVVHYLITPSVNGCAGTTKDVAVTVNTTAVINSAATATRCNNVETTYTATTSTVATTTYAWIRAAVTGISNPAVTNGTGAAITETLVNTSTEPVVVHYLITPSVNGCAGTTKDVAVTVNPTAVINSAATATRCNNVETTYTATTSTVATTTYAWTRAAVTGISNPAVTNGTGAAITETLENTSTEPVVVHYLITPSVNGCAGTTKDVAVTVNTLPGITTTGTAASVSYSPSAKTTTLAYTAATSSPSSYRIAWNAAAHTAGLTDQGSTVYAFVSGGGTLSTIAITGGTHTGTYNGTMTIANANGCTAAQAVSVTVNSTTISASDIAGVTPPVAGATPVSTVISGTGYTGTVTWSPAVATFGYSTIYTATITLTVTSGYTFTGVTANQFKIAGSSPTATNGANSGVITAAFPATGAAPAPPPSGGGGAPPPPAIIKTAQTITFGAISGMTMGDADITLGATASSGLAVGYASSDTNVASVVNGQIHLVGIGTTDITASQAGDASFSAAVNVVHTLVVKVKPIAGDANGDGKIDGTEINGDTNGDGKIDGTEIAGDTNGDGKIDGTEIAGDTNGDGKIDGTEIAGDTNGDGKIDGTEIAGDTNGDGKIDGSEIAGDTNGDGKIDGPEIAGDTNGDGKIDGSEIAGDTNGDGKIDGSEIAGDTNGDGIITSPELAGDANGNGKIDGTEIAGDPAVLFNPISNMIICSGSANLPVIFTVGNTGGTASYAWTNDKPIIGLGISGTGNILAFTALNAGTLPVVATIQVVPTLTSDGVIRIGQAKSFTITVNPSTVPTIAGIKTLCAGSSSVSYTTDASMTDYTWSVSPGGSITSGAGTNAVKVNWNSAGAQNVQVNYTNKTGCRASANSTCQVTVNSLPVPVISGVATVCAGSTGVIYSTEPFMTDYAWSVSPGGTITSGAGTMAIVVTWDSPGAKTVSVNYKNNNGCTSLQATVKNVTVNPTLVPTIRGAATTCVGATGVVYSTEPGMTGYRWSVTPGGTITSGAGTSSVTVSWTAAGVQNLGVNYTSSGGCSAAQATTMGVTVNPLAGLAGPITGATTVCGGTQGVVYSIVPIANVTGYVWSVPSGATIVSGAGTATVTVNFVANATSGVLSVYGTNACGNSNTSGVTVNVTSLVAAAASISGPSAVCQGSTGLIFTVVPVANATSYIWSVPAGATIVSGAGSNSIVVNLSMSTVSGQLTVYGSNSCSKGAGSQVFNLAVNAIPSAPVIEISGTNLLSSVLQGNQWFFSTSADGSGSEVSGATSATYTPTADGWYWIQLTSNGCLSAFSNRLYRLTPGEANQYNVFPVPNHGEFTIKITTPNEQVFTILIYDQLGHKLYEVQNLIINGDFSQAVNLLPASTGIYTIVIKSKDGSVIKKFNINK